MKPITSALAIFLAAVVLTSTFVGAQALTVRLSIVVLSSCTSQPILSATIMVVGATNPEAEKLDQTDRFGFATFLLPQGTYYLLIWATSYGLQTHNVSLADNQLFVYELSCA